MKKLSEITNWQEMIKEVVQGDCLEGMKMIPDKSIDLVVTDPPYGIKINRISNNFGSSVHLSRKATNDDWDDNIPSKEIFEEIFKISKNQIVFGANYFWQYFYATQCYIIWDKRGELPKVPFCDTEFAWTSFNKMSRKYTVINHGFVRDSKKMRQHPTQKPLELIRKILLDFTEEGDLVCDPFMGSWTTARACKDLKRNFMGFELEEKYCQIGEERLRQQNLF